MQEQVNYETCGAMILEDMKQLPVHYLEVATSCAYHNQLHTAIKHSSYEVAQIQQNLINMNREAIQDKFISMINTILSDIELKLKKQSGKWKKFSDFHTIIYQKLDKNVYPHGFELSSGNSMTTPKNSQLNKTKEDFQNQEIADHADLFFTELFEAMNKLLIVMKQFYGYEKDEQIQIAMYTAFLDFMENNQQSFIAQEDRLSMSRISSQRKSDISQESQKKEEVNESKKALFDVLESICSSNKKENADKKQEQKSSRLYSLVYDTVVNNLPFFGRDSQKSQKQKLREELISLLKKPKNAENFQLTSEERQIIDTFIELDQISILELMTKQSRQRYIQFVSFVMTEPDCQQFLQETKAHEQLANAVGRAYQINQSGENGSYILWIILLYKAFSVNYCPSRRNFLLNVCKKSQLQKNLKNPTFIFRAVESYFQKQSQILKQLRKLPALQNNKKQMKKLSDQKNDHLALMIQHELHRIHLYELKKKFEKPVLIQIDKLKECPKKKNISILFSGFLSQDTCKYQQWSAMIKSGYDSEMYTVRWQSKSLMDIGNFIYKQGVELVGVGALGGPVGPYLKAAALVKELYSIYQANPFNPALKCAEETGEFMAELLISSFSDNFINLVGFSLGTQVIYHILKRLAQRNKIGIINTVFLMGGAADKILFQKLLEQSPHIIRIVNMYSADDYILRYLLKVCKPSTKPIGLEPINQKIKHHKIKNIDATGVINGHLAYRNNLQVIEMMMKINDS